MIRLQRFENDSPVLPENETDRLDIGLNYIVKEHNIRFSFVWANQETDFESGGSADGDLIKLGFQLQL